MCFLESVGNGTTLITVFAARVAIAAAGLTLLEEVHCFQNA